MSVHRWTDFEVAIVERKLHVRDYLVNVGLPEEVPEVFLVTPGMLKEVRWKPGFVELGRTTCGSPYCLHLDTEEVLSIEQYSELPVMEVNSSVMQFGECLRLYKKAACHVIAGELPAGEGPALVKRLWEDMARADPKAIANRNSLWAVLLEEQSLMADDVGGFHHGD